MVKPKVLAIITARGGSKGLPRKNILPLAGKPLIAWTIEAAKKSRVIDKVILSSDDSEIIAIAKEYGCEVPFIRPERLANDTATSVDVVLHALEQVPQYDYFILLQPTSPLRTAEDIDKAFELMNSCVANSCASVVEVDKSPYWMFSMNESNRMSPVLDNSEKYDRRQVLPKAYLLNGAIYICMTDYFARYKKFVDSETVGYLMPKSRSMDVDTLSDYKILSFLIEQGNEI